MTRVQVLAALLGAGALSVAVSAYQAPAAAKVVEADKIKDNLYVLKGGGGNTTVFIGTDGVTVIDTKLAGWGAPVLAKIQELTPKPVTRIINTHSHGDHVSGNPEFPATVEIVAQENTAKNVEAWPPVYGLNNAFPDVIRAAGGKGMPKRLFKDKLTLGKDADRIDLFFFGRGHTNGDAWVLFPSLKVLVAADDFPSKGVPIMDKNAGGSGVEFPGTVARAYNTIKDADTIITGHSATTMTRDDLKVYGDFLKDFVAAVSAAKKAGQTPEQFTASWKVPEKYTGYPAAQAASVKNAATVVMEEVH